MKPTRGRVIIDCWDNGGRTADRYSIAITGLQSTRRNGQTVYHTYWLGASAAPFHPQGFGQHGGEIDTRDYFRSRYTHLGHPIDFLDLPPDVQRFIRGELQADPDNNKVRDIISHVRDMVRDTPEFDTDEPISGTELVDWFCAWRENAKDMLDLLDGGPE
jgi:hypothetical protein